MLITLGRTTSPFRRDLLTILSSMLALSISVRSPHTALAQETVGADPEAQAIQVQARTSLSKKASRYTSRIGTFQGISLHLVHVV